MRLRDLHILLAVAQHGTMAKAATHLRVSQPAVSEAISNLERVLGARLLERRRRGVEPTAYGAALVESALAWNSMESESPDSGSR
jgi:molybdate transport repressor ModE-like protein